MEFCELTEKEYISFLDKHPQKTFLHTPNIGKIREKDGWAYDFLGIKENNNLIAATMLLSRKEFIGKKEFFAIRGFLIDYNDYNLLSFFVKNIKIYIKKKNGFILRVDPYLIKQERDINGDIVIGGQNNTKVINHLKKLNFVERLAEQAKWMFVLDIENKNIEQLLKEMKPNTRNSINKTFKEGLAVRELNYNELDEFLKITDDTSERRNFTNKNLEYYQDMYKLFGDEVKFMAAELHTKEYLELLEIELETETKVLNSINNNNVGKIKEQEIKIKGIKDRIKEANELIKINDVIILSAAMFLLYGDEVIYFSSGNYKEYMHFYAQYRIQYEMIKYGTEKNFKLYNFYGISGNFDEKDSRYGVYKFKKGFNGYVVELIGEYQLAINKPYYFLYNILNCIKSLIKKLIRR